MSATLHLTGKLSAHFEDVDAVLVVQTAALRLGLPCELGEMRADGFQKGSQYGGVERIEGLPGDHDISAARAA